MLKPLDIFVCLYLSTVRDAPPLFETISEHLKISLSTAHGSMKRLQASGLVLPSRQVSESSLLELLLHGVRHVYYVQQGAPTRGIATADAAPPLSALLAATTTPPVWPDHDGNVRGNTVEPLHKSVPDVAKRDHKLYELLALVDAIRIGGARVRGLAGDELRKRLAR